MTVWGAGVVEPPVTAVPRVAVAFKAAPGVVVPPAMAVLAIAVRVPKSATIFKGSCPAGNGDTNKPVGIKVGVPTGACE
jgi:hypothetical protein